MLYIEGVIDKISRLTSRDDKKYDLIDIISRDEYKRLNLFPVSDWSLKGDIKEGEYYKIPIEIKVYSKKGNKDPQISYQRKFSEKKDDLVKSDKTVDLTSVEALLKKIKESDVENSIKSEGEKEGEKDIKTEDKVDPIPVESGNGKKTRGLFHL